MIDAAEKPGQGERTDLVRNGREVRKPGGNTSVRALRTLRSKLPDLHARVLAGEISPHAAMVEGGLRVRAGFGTNLAASVLLCILAGKRWFWT